MYPSSKLLMAAGAGSSKACSITIEFVIPLLQEQFFKHQQVCKIFLKISAWIAGWDCPKRPRFFIDTIWPFTFQCTPRRNILDIMNSFVTMAKESIEKDERCPLEKYKDNLLSLYTSELSNSNHQLRILAGTFTQHWKINCLVLKIPPIRETEEATKIRSYAPDIILNVC